DTVFTSVGSITQSFKIFNTNNQKLRLSTVQLMGGNASAFKININGITAAQVNNIELEANDSIYVFVTANINPSAQNLPFIVNDQILISYNGNNKYIQLQAYGQNAHFLTNKVIKQDTTWTNDLPYIILGSLQIDTNTILTIEKGCRIYSHANAPFLVDGTLKIKGDKNNPVIYTGDRLDADYKDLPASWPGIYFRATSKENVLQYTIVKNATQAIVADSLPVNNPKVYLQQCIIDNASDVGILCHNSSINAENCLISNCGKNVFISLGGNYQFTHCTIAAYNNIFVPHKFPAVQVNNYNDDNVAKDLTATFTNCIIWGDYGGSSNEVAIDKQGTNSFTVTFDHTLYKVITDPAYAIFNSVIKNQDPKFDNIDIDQRIFDFHISDTLAPGIDKGTLTSIIIDLEGNPRPVKLLPDMGCYETKLPN
ncbi:MAG: hypothetical protein HY305_02105, partial [Sphingobacteriales bacterium]|nr:hypothetical protein [Sphingobacteriales bacterium]